VPKVFRSVAFWIVVGVAALFAASQVFGGGDGR
jgi:hypothetical protein